MGKQVVTDGHDQAKVVVVVIVAYILFALTLIGFGAYCVG